MAIKERKIPSPSDIKSSPQKFAKQELDQLISLRDDINQITFKFGQIHLNKINLEKDEIKLKEQLISLEEKEKTLAETLSKKYGDGSIDLDFAKSSDFTQLKPNSAFEYTGGASEAAFKDKGLNYVGVKDGAFKVKGDTYHYGESGSGTSLLNKGKNAAGAYLSTLGGEDGPGYVAYGAGADTSLNPFGTRYDGTNVAHAGGGQFLTEEQKKYFAGQDLNIQGA